MTECSRATPRSAQTRTSHGRHHRTGGSRSGGHLLSLPLSLSFIEGWVLAVQRAKHQRVCGARAIALLLGVLPPSHDLLPLMARPVAVRLYGDRPGRRDGSSGRQTGGVRTRCRLSSPGVAIDFLGVASIICTALQPAAAAVAAAG